MAAEPWQRAEVPGPKRALVITKPEVVLAMLKKAKNPILVVGHGAVETDWDGEKPIDCVIRMAKAGKIPVVATAHTVGEFLERGFRPTAWMSAMDIGNRLTDPEWSVSDKKAPHDLALILGIPYYMGWVIESGLKTFAPSLKTVSLGRFYQPHCTWSFPNLSVEDWRKNLETIAGGVEKK
jgi:acetyl-CoA decarbonylase/synthase complex subunit epsilon